MGKEFTLGFGDKIGKNITLRDEGSYYCGEYIDGRHYSGVFGGTITDRKGTWFIVDGKSILVSSSTSIKFDD